MFTRFNRIFFTTMRAFGGRIRPRHRGAECSLRCDMSQQPSSVEARLWVVAVTQQPIN